MERRQTRSMTGNKKPAPASDPATASSVPTTQGKLRHKKHPNQPVVSPSLAALKTVQSKQPYDKNAWLKHNTGSQINVINRDDLQPDPAPVDSTSGFDVICSYNWHKAATPSIYVPGAPPQWKPQSLPFTLGKDEGEQFIDQNAYRVPGYPFEPLFRAIPLMSPNFKFNAIDFVANRNSMRKLLNFVNGKVYEPFRIDLNMVHDTLFLTRRERRTREIVSGTHKNSGFGHNFENYFTEPQPGLENSTSHHRVARYKLGDLDCVIRYEVDAWVPTEDVQNTSNVTDHAIDNDSKCGNDDGLLDLLKKLSLDKEGKKATKPHENATKVIRGGMAVDSSRLAELKSKSKLPNRAELVPQLWFGRIPHLVIGLHKDGNFGQISITETAEDFQKFETQQQDKLRKLVHTIKVLKQVTMSNPDRACVVVCDHKIKPLRLNVYSTTQKRRVLPPDLVRSHWTSKKS